MSLSDRIDIKKALVLLAAPVAALALVAVVSAGGSTTTAPAASPSPSATPASSSASPSPSATSASPSATPSASATGSYSDSDKDAFLAAVQDQTDAIWLEADEDIVSLADTIIDAHGREVAWGDVVTVLKKQYPDQDSKIYIRLVVIYLMKDLPASDPWKVAAAKPYKATEKPKPAPKPKPKPTEPEMSASQEQAVGKAEDYIDYSPFSKKGLIKQLKYEGFSTKDAEFAVEHIKVSWKEQAAAKAEDYLDYSHFSRSSLIRQLKYEGFTQAQAEYGAKKAFG